ncbi:NAD(P)H-binding protein [Methylobacterium sp. ID0610]|uniref:NAD(P)H-binding protein n=1 Tax=Methylobacterium carpenticola TaxID=3344827 RepID=UPI00367BD309
MKLLVLGATGLVGRHVLALSLEDARVEAVIAPARRALPAHPKLTAPVVDFDRLPADADWWCADAVICALGTTIRAAGSRAAFRKVDHDYPLAVARAAKARGASTFVLISAMSADPASRFFYSRVKGEVERDLAALGLRSLTLVRPALIGGERSEPRPAERAGSAVLGLLRPLLPMALRINPARRIARAALEAALAGLPGTRVIRSAELT